MLTFDLPNMPTLSGGLGDYALQAYQSIRGEAVDCAKIDRFVQAFKAASIRSPDRMKNVEEALAVSMPDYRKNLESLELVRADGRISDDNARCLREFAEHLFAIRNEATKKARQDFAEAWFSSFKAYGEAIAAI